eukprot:1586023-Rhodomonas_salina.2
MTSAPNLPPGTISLVGSSALSASHRTGRAAASQKGAAGQSMEIESWPLVQVYGVEELGCVLSRLSLSPHPPLPFPSPPYPPPPSLVPCRVPSASSSTSLLSP